MQQHLANPEIPGNTNQIFKKTSLFKNTKGSFIKKVDLNHIVRKEFKVE